jgi:hypothetical protein
MFKCCFSTSAEEPKKVPSGPISVAVKVAEKPVMLKFRMSPEQEQKQEQEEEPQVKEKAVFSVLPANTQEAKGAEPQPKPSQTTGKSVLRAALVISALYAYFYYTVAGRA